jgi:hypothetical protein
MLEDYRDLIDELLGTPSALRGHLAPPAEPGADTLRLVDELRARDEAVLVRLNAMIRTRDAVLGELDVQAASGDSDAAAVLAGFDHARGELVSLLMNLTIRDWDAAAIGPDGRRTVVSEQVEEHVDFDEGQRARILAGATA